jgi:hypothetical protein
LAKNKINVVGNFCTNKNSSNKNLRKSSSSPYFQESINEWFSSILMQELNVDCVDYSIRHINNKPFSLCDCFVDKNSELIHIRELVNYFIKKNNK